MNAKNFAIAVFGGPILYLMIIVTFCLIAPPAEGANPFPAYTESLKPSPVEISAQLQEKADPINHGKHENTMSKSQIRKAISRLGKEIPSEYTLTGGPYSIQTKNGPIKKWDDLKVEYIYAGGLPDRKSAIGRIAGFRPCR
ncbi:hypothetical protein KKA15_06605 [Patescibacteria group bacterium]|nr:hypothetical protein [Patescibacteria group bacterium]